MDEQEIAEIVRKSVRGELDRLAKADGGEVDAEQLRKDVMEVENDFLANVQPEVREAYLDSDAEEQMDALSEYSDDPERFIGEADEELGKAYAAAEDAEPTEEEFEEAIAQMSPEELAELADEIEAPQDAGDVADAVAEGQEQVVKAFQEELAERDARIAELEAAADFEEAADIAEREFGNLPGSTMEKASLVMAIQDMPKAQADILIKSLASAQELSSGADYFDETGTAVRPDGDDLAKSDSMLAKAQAMHAEHPDKSMRDCFMEVMSTPEGQEIYKRSRDAARAGGLA